MPQHDFDIANQTPASFRADLNLALSALATLSSGPSAPATTSANMLWYDTGVNTLKVRSEADDAWLSVGYLNQSLNEFSLFDDTKVVNGSGTQTGLIGDQATSAWEAGTSTTESLVSPVKVKATVVAATAASTVGAIGTYAMLSNNSGSGASAGDTKNGSDLLYSSASSQDTSSPSGVWRCMGFSSDGNGGDNDTTLWLRIS